MTDLIERLGGIITSPRETLEQLSKEMALKGSFIVVLLAGALFGIWLGMLLPYLLPELMPLIPLGFTEFFVLGLISTLLSWVIFAGISHLVAKLLMGGKGEYSMLLQLMGYAHVPYLLIYPLSLIIHAISPVLSSVIDLIGIVWAFILTIFAIGIAERFSILMALVTLVVSTVAIIVLTVAGMIALIAIAGIPLV